MPRHQPPQSVSPEGRQAQQMNDVMTRLSTLENARNTTAFLTRKNAQAIGAGGYTRIEFDASVETPAALWEALGYIVPTAGMYLCTGQYTLAAQAGVAIIASLAKNGAEIRRGTRISVAATGPHSMTVTSFVSASAGDRLELLAFNGGAATTLEILEGTNNYLCVTKIG